jgi:HD-GYP domain-containing protein (c-di-GMP phosphodiesterase class II)
MRRISVEKLKAGMTLGRSLYAGPNQLALAAGSTLDPQYINLMSDHGYLYAHIEDEGFSDIKPQDILSDTARRLAESAMEAGAKALKHAVQLKSETTEITEELLKSEPDLFNVSNVDDMTRAVSSIVKDIIDKNIHLVDIFAQVARTTYVYRHGVNVTALAVMIGRKFGFTSRQLRELALAALLHDFGKICLGKMMDTPKHALEGEDLNRFEEHPTYGAILIQNTDPTMVNEQLGIWHHHEWQNGEGYPQTLAGSNISPTRDYDPESGEIHPYAEIIAVVEAYDNLVNGNGELPRPLDPADALGMLMSFSGKRFNTGVYNAFSQIVALYPTGSMVQIEKSTSFGLEGYYAVVKEQGETPNAPVLILYANPDGKRVKPKTMNFTKDSELRLKLMV